jgi:hypothetical protein
LDIETFLWKVKSLGHQVGVRIILIQVSKY